MYTKSLGRYKMFPLVLVGICIVLGAVGQILMKNGMNQVGEVGGIGQLLNPNTFFTIFTNLFVLGGLLLYGIAAILWLGAMSSLNISFMYPLLSIGYILAALMGALFLKEDVTIIRWAGIGFVVLGCFLVLRS